MAVLVKKESESGGHLWREPVVVAGKRKEPGAAVAQTKWGRNDNAFKFSSGVAANHAFTAASVNESSAVECLVSSHLKLVPVSMHCVHRK